MHVAQFVWEPVRGAEGEAWHYRGGAGAPHGHLLFAPPPGLTLQPAAILHNLTRFLRFWQVGSIDLAVSVDYARDGEAASTTDEIGYTYTITNNGLLTLYNIGLRTEDPDVEIACGDTDGSASDVHHQSVDDLASYLGDHGLAPAASLVCRATGGVSRAAVSPRATKDFEKCVARAISSG